MDIQRTKTRDRTQSQLRRLLSLIDALSQYRTHRTIDQIQQDVLLQTVSRRTISRDLELLSSMGLVEQIKESPKRYRLKLTRTEGLQRASIELDY